MNIIDSNFMENPENKLCYSESQYSSLVFVGFNSSIIL